MRRQAKASSAFTHGRSASVAAGPDAGSFATRGASSGFDGSGARSKVRNRTALLALVASTAALLALAPAALAHHSFDRFIGGPSGGAEGGEFNVPNGLADDPVTGQIYVTDIRNHRVQRLSADGHFELTFGEGALTGADKAEVCTAAQAPCRGGFGFDGQGEGMFASPASVVVSPTNGDIYVADDNNFRVQQFSLDDNGTPGDPADDLPVFVRTWGWGVQDGTAEFQICTAGCQSGLPGSGIGQVADFKLAVSPLDGDVFAAGRGRIQRFDEDGTLDPQPVIGSSAVFSQSNTPTAVAVDSRGVLYAGNRTNSGQIERYDTIGNVHSSGAPGFLAPIPAPPLLAGTGSDVTNGLALHLDSDGAGPDVDRLYVARNPSSGNSRVQQIDSPSQVENPGVDNLWPAARTTDDAQHGETHFGTASLNSAARGFAYDSARDRMLFTSLGSFGSVGEGVYILDADGAPPPGLTADAQGADNIDTGSADLSGTIDPGGGLARFRFEYSRDGVDWTSSPLRTVSGSGGQPVVARATGLDPNATYRMRLSAERVLGPTTIESQTSAEAVFVTDAAAPDATTMPPHAYTDTSAWLAGEIDPNNSPTAYHFEWGKTKSYGQQAPFPSADAGAGVESVHKLIELSGLEPDTTYHYRLVASSPQGTTVGEDVSFTTRFGFAGFADRAFEQVSPVDKNGADIAYGATASADKLPVSANGETATFSSWGAFADQQWGGSLSRRLPQYAARRGTDGWTTRALMPRPPGVRQTQVLGWHLMALSGPNGEQAVINVPPPLSYLPGEPQADGIYRHDLRSGLVSPLAVVPPASTIPSLSAGGGEPSGFRGAADGLVKIAFATTADSFTGAEDAGVPAGVLKVYEWEDGQIRLASRDPSGAPFTFHAIVGSHATSGSEHAVSEDGRHLFFSGPLASLGNGAPNDATQIYRRDDGASTILASPSKRSTPDPAGPAAKLFLGASADGDEVFFTSSELLTDDANTGPTRGGRDLYRYQVSTDTLIDVSATPGGDGAQVQGVVGISEDGEWVYYVARGQVIPGEGVQGGQNLYAWHDDGSGSGETRLIATLDDMDENNYLRLGVFINVPGAESEFARSSRVSEDGETLLFQSSASLTGYPNRGHAQVFVYEADERGGAGQLSCVSCRPDGTPAAADAEVPISSFALFDGERARALTPDGETVFFDSGDRLSAADRDELRDVYEWREGRLRLVSLGDAERPSRFQGASRNGRDVFFTTGDQLVGQDADTLLDLYDARVGGGIAAQNPPPPGEPCAGDACKPAAAPAPSPAAPPTAGFQGEGNYTPPFRVDKLSRKQLRALARRGRVGLRVRVERPGRVVVRAIKGKRMMGRGSRVAAGPRTVTVPLRLRHFARRILQVRGKLRMRVEVRFAGERRVAGLALREAGDRRKAGKRKVRRAK